MSTSSPCRCHWVPADNALYQDYHDKEWGVPVHHDDRKQFEFLILEGAQAGLSWLTILKKREGYRRLFAEFDPSKVAKFTDEDIERILLCPDIVRNRLKVTAAVNNAKRFLEIQKEFGSFSKYIWDFVGGKPIVNKWKTHKELPAETEISKALSRDLRKRGFNFVGSKVMYAHMQALGLVNDHTIDCFRYKQV